MPTAISTSAEILRAIGAAECIASNLTCGAFDIAREEIAAETSRVPLIQAVNDKNAPPELKRPAANLLRHLGAAYGRISDGQRDKAASRAPAIREYCRVIRDYLGTVAADPTTAKAGPRTDAKTDVGNGRVWQSQLPWPAHLKTDKQRLAFLDGHRAEIPNHSEGHRRKVDAAAFISYWAKNHKAGFDSLDSSGADSIVPETIHAAEFLENVVPLLQQVAGTKSKKRQRNP